MESGLPYAGILTGLILLAFLSAGHLSESRLPVWKKSWKFWLVVSTALVTVVMDFWRNVLCRFRQQPDIPASV
ncbi:MAG: hypothetical protein ACLU99_06480 [Alphaproteobacteria bacterium]